MMHAERKLGLSPSKPSKRGCLCLLYLGLTGSECELWPEMESLRSQPPSELTLADSVALCSMPLSVFQPGEG